MGQDFSLPRTKWKWKWLELWLYNCYLIKKSEWESDIIKCEKGVTAAMATMCSQCLNKQPSVQNMKTYRIIHGPIEKFDQIKKKRILKFFLSFYWRRTSLNYFWFHYIHFITIWGTRIPQNSRNLNWCRLILMKEPKKVFVSRKCSLFTLSKGTIDDDLWMTLEFNLKFIFANTFSNTNWDWRTDTN